MLKFIHHFILSNTVIDNYQSNITCSLGFTFYQCITYDFLDIMCLLANFHITNFNFCVSNHVHYKYIYMYMIDEYETFQIYS